MVAHPDDCVIFGWSFMYNHAHLPWTVGYLTYDAESDRGQELARFWHRRGVSTVFLGYVDDYHDLETGVCSFDTVAAGCSIRDLVTDYDLILTHDPQGDYGHLHHRFVYHSVAAVHDRIITFAPTTGPGARYEIPGPAYDSEELPLHRSVIQGFHSELHANRYCIPDCCIEMLQTETVQ